MTMWKVLRDIIQMYLIDLGCTVEIDGNHDILVSRHDGVRTIISFYEYKYKSDKNE